LDLSRFTPADVPRYSTSTAKKRHLSKFLEWVALCIAVAVAMPCIFIGDFLANIITGVENNQDWVLILVLVFFDFGLGIGGYVAIPVINLNLVKKLDELISGDDE
jgi:hypothetical protein